MMARRSFAPVAGRRQADPAPPAAPAQTLLPNALLAPLDQLVPDPGQPRRHFDEAALAELAASIEEEGVLQPLLVYEDGALDDGRLRYTILDGERRYRASLRVRTDAPVIVVSGRDVADIRVRQLVANLQREELDPLEEALALRQLMQLSGLGIKNIAKRIGKPVVYVQRRNDLLYDPRLMEAVQNGRINASVAVELRHFPEEQRHTYQDRVASGERLEVAQLREAKREEKRRARAVLFGEAGAPAARAGDGASSAQPDRAGYRVDTPVSLPADYPATDAASPTANGYRFDTPVRDVARGADKAATETPDVAAVESARVQQDDAQEGSRGNDATGWAMGLADALLQGREGGQATGLIEAVEAWRLLGRPVGWGDALLAALLAALDARIQ